MNAGKYESTAVRTLYNDGSQSRPGLYVMKFLAAFAVVFIHFPTIYYYQETLFLARFAVPVFLMVTGYYLLDGNGNLALTKIWRSLRKLAILFLWSNVFYLVAKIWLDPDFSLPPVLSAEYVAKIFIYGGQYGYHLWYVTAVFWALALTVVAKRLHFLKLLVCISPLISLAALLIGKYHFLIPDIQMPFYTVFSYGCIFSLPSLYLGMIIRKYEHKLIHLPWKYILLATVVISSLEVYLFIDRFTNGETYIFTLPLQTAVFCFFLRSRAYPPRLVKAGCRYAMYIYVFHIFIGMLYGYFIGPLSRRFGVIIIFIFSLALAIIVDKGVRYIKGAIMRPRLDAINN